MTRTERWEGERWPEVEREPRGLDPVRDEPPIVNPYAVVALVAALLGLFPVAIVFGLIAFSYPRGKAMALFALLLGMAEVAALAAVLVLGTGVLTDAVNRTGKQAAPELSVVPATVRTTTTTAPAPSSTTPATSTDAPVTGTPVKGAACSESQVGVIGTAADGATLLCLFSPGVNGGYRWAGPHPISSTVQQTGTTCDPAKAKSARTTDGRALVCEGQGRNAMWVPWTE